MKHKIQINNKNVYLLNTITYTQAFYFIKGNPYKNYTDKNHFVSKRIQNRKTIFKKTEYVYICTHYSSFISWKGHSGIDWCVMINVIVQMYMKTM